MLDAPVETFFVVSKNKGSKKLFLFFLRNAIFEVHSIIHKYHRTRIGKITYTCMSIYMYYKWFSGIHAIL